ncbi:unnamed protein product [Oikopleura dioica]|uniref:Protein kinase domain-containing protein n=1 Tax=Oikopleura dioica TaxID=34765 RepID=E4Y1Y7_OIKDI|nr:unnamed protein product [Oikopleura dioica]
MFHFCLSNLPVKRKKIGEGILDGFLYLKEIGISHFDQKLENILLVDGIPKIIDFGLIREKTGRSGYREMGYARKGSKFRKAASLSAATPGFADQMQFTIGNGYEKCNAISIHKIKEFDKRPIIREITSIISIPSSSSHFCLDDPNLTKSVQVSSLKQNVTKCVNQDLENVTKNVLDQKSSNLCVPISVTTLLRFAIKNDLGFDDINDFYSVELILSTLTLIVYPRSMAGLNLNPNQKETEFQLNEIELLLERLCKKTYLMETGWNIIRKLDGREKLQPKKSTCKFEQVILHENFIFSRPLTVTGAYLLPNDEVFFHQMTLDRIENNEYVLQNNHFSVNHPPVIRIKQRFPHYAIPQFIDHLIYQTGNNIEFVGNIQNVLISERHNMNENEWYLLPHAYSITLVPE